MTTVPFIGIVSNTSRMALVAASSASSFKPLPIQRADFNAAASVTRTSSIDKLLSIFVQISSHSQSLMNFEVLLFLGHSAFHARWLHPSLQASPQAYYILCLYVQAL
ncbi:hypothetical protein C883_3341 [Bacillus stratosphericus LAMA 585]|nr:hypothetical protein C883_3341 [Bacillus stratosphericus LAMA 585]